MTRDDVGDDDAGGGDRRAFGQAEEAVDELVEPSVDLRTAQEKEAAANAEAATGDDSGESGKVTGDGLEELVEPATDIRSAQEQEAADAAVDAQGDESDGDVEGECDE